MALAHSPNEKGEGHPLVDHLRQVAVLASDFASKFEAAELGYWAGLWHDVGKFHPDFQAYLISPNRNRGPDHKGAGALLACRRSEPLSFLIAGHHGGLPSRDKLKYWLREKEKAPEVEKAIEIGRAHLAEIEPGQPIAFPRRFSSKHEVEFFLRMLFSALTDADFLDTEKHFSSEKSAQRKFTVSLASLWGRFHASQEHLTGKYRDPVNRVRHSVYRACVRAGELPQGFFRLTVPTGGGKTRSAFAFGLRHSLKHRLERVIVAIPYTSIIEQTASEYRKILGPEAVLEHHSGATPSEDEHNPSLHEVWQRLASENWDAPVVVTTTVQLFESLFSNGTAKCRKLHNIAKSVLILDEVQTLPVRLLVPILDALRQLVAHYRVTVVLCTATQPALDESPFLKGLPNVREIAPNPARLFSALKRIRYDWSQNRMSWFAIADEMRKEGQALAVVNTKRDAMALLDALDDPEAFHLSTQMCGAHRHDTLEMIKALLVAGKPCRLVSTQVVEAGVDLDFPFVLRAIGPLDRIVQAAGRCNREGRLEVGRVLVFDPQDGSLPDGEYRSATDNTLALIRSPSFAFDNPEVYKRYFQHFYQVAEKDSKNIQKLRESFNYPEVSQRFRLIEEDTVPVVVRYAGKDGNAAAKYKKAVDQLIMLLRREHEETPRWILRKLQPYLVNMYWQELSKYERDGWVKELRPGLWEWFGPYDRVRGIVVPGVEVERLVV